MDSPTQFPNIASKSSTFCNAKILIQKDSKIVDLDFEGAKEALSGLEQDPMIEPQKKRKKYKLCKPY
jgi:hypothetical protein